MHLQNPPRKPAPELASIIDKIDDVTREPRRSSLPAQQEITPPIYGGPQRDAINSLVDNIVADICNKVGELRKLLDSIEQHALTSGAKQKHSLNGHVATCIHINDEIVHMRGVIADLAEQARAIEP